MNLKKMILNEEQIRSRVCSDIESSLKKFKEREIEITEFLSLILVSIDSYRYMTRGTTFSRIELDDESKKGFEEYKKDIQSTQEQSIKELNSLYLKTVEEAKKVLL